MHQPTKQTATEPLELLTYADLGRLLKKSRASIDRMRKDPSFPKAIKEGDSRQGRVYFVAEEVAKWQAGKMAARVAA